MGAGATSSTPDIAEWITAGTGAMNSNTGAGAGNTAEAGKMYSTTDENTARACEMNSTTGWNVNVLLDDLRHDVRHFHQFSPSCGTVTSRTSSTPLPQCRSYPVCGRTSTNVAGRVPGGGGFWRRRAPCSSRSSTSLALVCSGLVRRRSWHPPPPSCHTSKAWSRRSGGVPLPEHKRSTSVHVATMNGVVAHAAVWRLPSHDQPSADR